MSKWKMVVLMMVLLSVTCVAAEKKKEEEKKETPKPCQTCVQHQAKIRSLETKIAQLEQHIAGEKQKLELSRKLMVRALAVNDQ